MTRECRREQLIYARGDVKQETRGSKRHEETRVYRGKEVTNGEDGGRGGVASDLRRAKGVGGGGGGYDI